MEARVLFMSPAPAIYTPATKNGGESIPHVFVVTTTTGVSRHHQNQTAKMAALMAVGITYT
jgi:hypothetical protein